MADEIPPHPVLTDDNYDEVSMYLERNRFEYTYVYDL